MTKHPARWLRSTVAAAALSVAATGVEAQQKEISFYTWNIPVAEDLITGWIEKFESEHPDVTVEWIDRKGTEWATFYQTQLAAGTAPDIIDVQGGLWLQYADDDGLVDLTPYLEENPGFRERFNADYLANWVYEGRNYMVPFYISKTLLFYNKEMFAEAGLDGPPESFDELLSHAAELAGGERTGFQTLNFDWLYWPLFAMNGVELLDEDYTEAAFNTPKMVETLTRLAEATEKGHINTVSWTGRWVEPNNAFAAGTVGMHHAHSPAYFYIKGQGQWVSPETMGAAHMPGYYATPNSHGLGVSATTEHPDEAVAFVEMITSEAQAYAFSSKFNVLTGNIAADERLMADIKAEDELGYQVLKTQLEHTDKLVGNWAVAQDAQIKEAFYPDIQAALLGQKDPAQAIADAEAKVNRILRRRR